MNNGHWNFDAQMQPAGNAGFVYAIYDTVMGVGYIGKKNYYTSSDGRRMESTWRHYKSSSNNLKLLFNHRPKEEFEFYCLEEYKTLGDLAYAESWSIIQARCLENELWYNRGVESVGWKVKRPPTPRHRSRLEMICQKVYG